ncbi:MAG: radical SAM protein [Verrucomicrobiota bacterium]
MGNEVQIKSGGNGTEGSGQKEQPWLKIGDEEIYVLNPLYRLRNSSNNCVLVWGAEGLSQERVHSAAGVVLALCNGKRTVAEIGGITRPLVKIADDAKATEVARARVKSIIHTMTRTREERIGQQQVPNEYPAAAVLITRAEYDRKFSHTKFRGVEYHVRDFIPQNAPGTVIKHTPNPREAAPMKLIWHFTSACSTDCRYCYLGRRKVTLLPKERVLALIEEAAAIGVVEIHPLGGDFLLYPYLNELLAAMRKYQFLPAGISTKSFLSKEKAAALAESAAVTNVQFSIDSTVEDVADYLVRAKGFCNRIFESIANALEAGLCVEAKVVITPYNILTIPKLYRDLKKRGVSTIRLATYFRSGFHHSNDLFNHSTSYQWLEEQVKQLQKEFPDDVIYIQNGRPQLKLYREEVWPDESKCCSAGRSSMMICADGKVIPCEQMPETEEYFCGDVGNQSIQEVWYGARLREMTYSMPREKFKGQACYDCAEWERCVCQIGYCIRDLALFYGDIYQPPPNCLKHNRDFIRLK